MSRMMKLTENQELQERLCRNMANYHSRRSILRSIKWRIQPQKPLRSMCDASPTRNNH